MYSTALVQTIGFTIQSFPTHLLPTKAVQRWERVPSRCLKATSELSHITESSTLFVQFLQKPMDVHQPLTTQHTSSTTELPAYSTHAKGEVLCVQPDMFKDQGRSMRDFSDDYRSEVVVKS